MTLLAHLFSDISFFEIGASLIAVGLIERGLLLLPESIVGDGGWLYDTGRPVQ